MLQGLSLTSCRRGSPIPREFCIAGAGNNGYVALTGMIFLPDQYACAISLRGFNDIRVLLRGARDVGQLAINTFNSSLVRNRREYADADIVRFAPALHGGTVRSADSKLIIGDIDYTSDQALSMRNALAVKGKQVELVEIDDESWRHFTRAKSAPRCSTTVDRFRASPIRELTVSRPPLWPLATAMGGAFTPRESQDREPGGDPMRAQFLISAVVATVVASFALAQAAETQTRTFMNSKEIMGLIAKAKADRKGDAPLVAQPILSLAPYRASSIPSRHLARSGP